MLGRVPWWQPSSLLSALCATTMITLTLLLLQLFTTTHIIAAGEKLPDYTDARSIKGPTRIGDYHNITISTNLLTSDIPPRISNDGQTYSYTLRHTNASFLAVHFHSIDLPPRCYIDISESSGAFDRSRLENQGFHNLRRFWAQHVVGDEMVIQLHCGDDTSIANGTASFRINKYTAGYASTTHGRKLQGRRRRRTTICHRDDRKNAICYKESYSTAYLRARAVARLFIHGAFTCTGFLISHTPSLLMTNEHCLRNQWDAENTDFEFMGEESSCDSRSGNCVICERGEVYRMSRVVRVSHEKDYAVVELEGNPALSYGYLHFDTRPTTSILNKQIYIPQHPAGRAKEIGITDSTHSSYQCTLHPSTVRACLNVNARSYGRDVAYNCDTEGGSSGAPVLARDSHKVVALHHCGGGCNGNMGVPVGVIYPEVKGYINDNQMDVYKMDVRPSSPVSLKLFDVKAMMQQPPPSSPPVSFGSFYVRRRNDPNPPPTVMAMPTVRPTNHMTCHKGDESPLVRFHVELTTTNQVIYKSTSWILTFNGGSDSIKNKMVKMMWNGATANKDDIVSSLSSSHHETTACIPTDCYKFIIYNEVSPLHTRHGEYTLTYNDAVVARGDITSQPASTPVGQCQRSVTTLSRGNHNAPRDPDDNGGDAAPTTLFYNNFERFGPRSSQDNEENGWGVFHKVGHDAGRHEGNSAHSGTGTLVIRSGGSSNKGESFVYTRLWEIDTGDYKVMELSFWYYLKYFEKKTDWFALEYSFLRKGDDGNDLGGDAMKWDRIKLWSYSLSRDTADLLGNKDNDIFELEKWKYTDTLHVDVEGQQWLSLRFLCGRTSSLSPPIQSSSFAEVHIDDVHLSGLHSPSSPWTTISFHNFEDGLGIFKKGGRNAMWQQGGTARSGTSSMVISDNRGERSSVYTPTPIDTTEGGGVLGTGLQQLRMTFWFLTKSFRGTDLFYVSYSVDEGVSWTVAKKWQVESRLSGSSFGSVSYARRDVIETVYFENNDLWLEGTVSFDLGGGGKHMKDIMVRFVCDAKYSYDKVFIDDVLFSVI